MAGGVLARLETPELVALRCRGGDWPRSRLSPALIPDKWMGLVTGRDGRRRAVPAGEDPRPERDDTLLLVRNRPVTVPIRVAGVPAADPHNVDGTVDLLVRCPFRDDELAAVQQTLLSEDALTLASLKLAIEHAGGHAAVRAFVQARAAAALVESDLRPALLGHLREALKSFLFSAGLELEDLGRCTFESASFAQHAALTRASARRVQELEARGVVEEAALRATQRRLDDLGSVLTKLKDAAASDANLRWRELLPALTPGERGRLLENLWRLTPDQRVATAIVVVAGHDVVWLSPNEPERIVRRIAVTGELGGLRSVSYDAERDELLIGAATGVWRLRGGDGEIIQRYVVATSLPTQTGFNAAIMLADRLFATHSQLGAWSWSLDRPAESQPLVQPQAGMPRTVRAIVAAGPDLVLFATDEHVRAFGIDGTPRWQSGAADSAIHCLSPLETEVYAGTSRGSLLRCDLQQPGEWRIVHRARSAIETIIARRWDDLTELVIPAGSDGVQGIYGSEGIVALLLRAAYPIRRAWASDDTLVALTEQRDRLIVLNAAIADRSGREVPVARLLGQLVQDACIVSDATRSS